MAVLGITQERLCWSCPLLLCSNFVTGSRETDLQCVRPKRFGARCKNLTDHFLLFVQRRRHDHLCAITSACRWLGHLSAQKKMQMTWPESSSTSRAESRMLASASFIRGLESPNA